MYLGKTGKVEPELAKLIADTLPGESVDVQLTLYRVAIYRQEAGIPITPLYIEWLFQDAKPEEEREDFKTFAAGWAIRQLEVGL